MEVYLNYYYDIRNVINFYLESYQYALIDYYYILIILNFYIELNQGVMLNYYYQLSINIISYYN